MLDTCYRVAYLRPRSRHYSTVCGCLLERTRHGALYFPCASHFGIPYEIEARQDGGVSLFMDRPAFFDGLKKKEG